MDVVGRAPGVYVTEYSYRDAVYDGRQREFRGFRTARARKVGDSNSPSSTTESTFLLGECTNDEGASPDPCTPEGKWQDNPREALKGLPLLSETHDENGVYQSSAHHTYRLRKLYAGLDGREVRHAFESQSDTYLYDNAPFVSDPKQASLTDVELETSFGTVASETTSSSISLTLRASGGRAHLRKSAIVDAFGNATDAIDDGCVEGCRVIDGQPVIDESITTRTSPGRPIVASTDDPSGWLYRTVESYVVGSVTPGQRKHMLVQYDLGGNPLQTKAVLAGTLPLDRFHEDPTAPVAAPPPSASHDGTILVSTQIYDQFGQLQHQAAPNQRCRDVTYDATYDELPVLETVFAGAAAGTCGAIPLHTIATWDRGWHVVATFQDPTLALTKVSYDNFGRLSSLFRPDPDPTKLGSVSGAASVFVEYFLPTDPAATPYSLLHTKTQNGADSNATSYHESWAYVDGLGRPIATLDQADPSTGDAGAWIVNGLTDYDAKGAVRRKYLASFYSGADPKKFPLGRAPPSLYGSQRYDAFGRQLQTFGLDGVITLQSKYHALSVDKWDAADLLPGPHQGTPASATQDGHGRTLIVTERIHNGNAIEARDLRTTYLSTGEPAVIARVRVGAADLPIVRWIRYDSLGRMVLNVEPNATKGFSADPTTDPSTMKAWRYAYDDNGELVGTSDARGCGVNYHYDAGGRILAEDFSPCLLSQPGYTTPNLTTGDSTEAFYVYDDVTSDPEVAALPDFQLAATQGLFRGRLVAVSDRGAKAATLYDGRGRAVHMARRIAKPDAAAQALAARYAPHWYKKVSAYDGADRPVSVSTGVDSGIPALLDASGQSVVTTQYSQRGTVKSVGTGYGAASGMASPLVSSITRDADGLIGQVVYGDAAATTSALSYDGRRRLSSAQTYRGAPAIWSAPPASYLPSPSPNGSPSTFQLLLEDTDFLYDQVDNPTEIRDWRSPSEWPAGAQPVTRKIQYDDLYRATDVSYASPNGSDSWTSPFAAEDPGTSTDPRRGLPSPHISFPNRVMSQNFQYDWLGNTVLTDDDAHGFYDRSVGTVTNGTASAGPYQLEAATGSGPRGGTLTTAYDPAGNLTSMALSRSGACLPAGAICSQRFAYDWDEVGRLVHARRWDTATPATASAPLPSGAPSAELRHAYDATDQRTLKTAIDASGTTVYDAYVFDSLELRSTSFTEGDFRRDSSTEVAYLSVHGVRLGRLYYALDSEPSFGSGKLHILLEMPDHLGSTSLVVDRDTSELVERGTYTTNGGPDSDYRPGRWNSFREDYRFTGKEEDIEVGLQYFGKRFLSPYLGRWISADPLTVHGLGGDANAYAYVHGQLLRIKDPTGLQGSPDAGTGPTDVSGAPPQPGVLNVPEITIAGRAEAQPASESATANDAKAEYIEGKIQNAVQSFRQANNKGFQESTHAGLPHLPNGGVLNDVVQATPGAAVVTSTVFISTLGTAPASASALSKVASLPKSLSTAEEAANVAGVSVPKELLPPAAEAVGAAEAPVGPTVAGERFVRVGAGPANLRFTFETPGGAQPGTYAFPESTFNQIGQNPAALKNFGDLPGTPPQYFRILEPPPGTPIQRGIVPGGQFGGVGGVPEVLFPEGF